MKQIYTSITFLTILLSVVFIGSWQNVEAQGYSPKEPLRADLKLYPNPCREKKLTVEFTSKEISEIRITNIAGKEVYYSKIKIPTGKTQVILENLPYGMYMVNVRATDNTFVVQKLIVASI